MIVKLEIWLTKAMTIPAVKTSCITPGYHPSAQIGDTNTKTGHGDTDLERTTLDTYLNRLDCWSLSSLCMQ
jgi:hypothetical protein